LLLRKKKKFAEKRERLEGEERERVAVAAWWLCWLPVVELVVALVGGWIGGEREGEKKTT
jgi:hypothetical protein